VSRSYLLSPEEVAARQSKVTGAGLGGSLGRVSTQVIARLHDRRQGDRRQSDDEEGDRSKVTASKVADVFDAAGIEPSGLASAAERARVSQALHASREW
jgi:hypothetical protein